MERQQQEKQKFKRIQNHRAYSAINPTTSDDNKNETKEQVGMRGMQRRHSYDINYYKRELDRQAYPPSPPSIITVSSTSASSNINTSSPTSFLPPSSSSKQTPHHNFQNFEATLGFSSPVLTSENHFCPLKAFLYNMHETLEGFNYNMVVYDLGLSMEHMMVLEELKNSNYISDLRVFNFSKYPSFWDIKNARGEYAWKPGMIKEVSEDYPGTLVWLDSGTRRSQNDRAYSAINPTTSDDNKNETKEQVGMRGMQRRHSYDINYYKRELDRQAYPPSPPSIITVSSTSASSNINTSSPTSFLPPSSSSKQTPHHNFQNFEATLGFSSPVL
ncbi:4773_t:CDS:2, partial [Entrophospora sp. SA101]